MKKFLIGLCILILLPFVFKFYSQFVSFGLGILSCYYYFKKKNLLKSNKNNSNLHTNQNTTLHDERLIEDQRINNIQMPINNNKLDNFIDREQLNNFEPGQNDIDYKRANVLTKKWANECLKEFVVIDFETTGLNCKNDYIIEIAAIRFKNSQEVEKFFTLVRPPISISKRITKINGITNEMVANAPAIDEVIVNLCSFLQNSIIVAHNASFDMGYLLFNANKYGIKLNNTVIDTLATCRKLYRSYENHKLGTICKCMNIKVENAHRAKDDARACAQILLNCIKDYNSSLVR